MPATPADTDASVAAEARRTVPPLTVRARDEVPEASTVATTPAAANVSVSAPPPPLTTTAAKSVIATVWTTAALTENWTCWPDPSRAAANASLPDVPVNVTVVESSVRRSRGSDVNKRLVAGRRPRRDTVLVRRLATAVAAWRAAPPNRVASDMRWVPRTAKWASWIRPGYPGR